MNFGHVAKLTFCALCGLVLTGAEQNPPGTAAEGFKALNESRYAEAQQLFRRAAFDDDCKVRDRSLVSIINDMQEWTDSGFVYQDTARVTFDEEFRAAVDGAQARDALDEIVRRAANTRVVMLNEHHHYPRSRAFAAELARRLRPLGYNVLATETFTNNPDSAIMDRTMTRMVADGYPRQGDGFYTTDPVYGSFVRTALALGYKPVAYETTNFQATGTPQEQINRRDQDEADHLAEIVRRNPKSKILVYVGFGHLYEKAMESVHPMGERFKEQTGIDPLTIEQTNFMAGSLKPSPDPFVAKVVARAKGHSIILFKNGSPVGPLSGSIDLQVVHPMVPDRAGRPGWLFTSDRRPMRAPASLMPKDGDILVQVFGKSDAASAIPIDQVIWRKGAPAPTLALLPGPVRYAAEPIPTPICPGIDIFLEKG